MKKCYLFAVAIQTLFVLALLSCSSDNSINDDYTQVTDSSNAYYKLVINATKNSGNESTRGLSLSGSTLNAKWDEGESVTAYKVDGITWTEAGTLTAAASENATTTLSGTITIPLEVGNKLCLIFPRPVWNYTGQNGILYDGSSETTIAKKYDYSRATVYVKSIIGSNVTVQWKDAGENYHDGAIFENEQAITKFTFSVPVKSVTIKSSSAGLVQYFTLDPSFGLGFYSTNGDLTITASTDQTVFYVAMRMDSEVKDIFTFSATDASNNHYTGIKTAKLVNGNYYSADVTLSPVGVHNNHEYVDLGLPSGTKWATMNVEASSVIGSGGYYAWAETTVKGTYNWTTYQYGDNSSCTNLGDITGSSTYDVARVKWGGSWQMPTIDDFNELKNNCTWTWTTLCGVKGNLVTASNGNSIFLPAAGGYFDFNSTNIEDVGTYGYYWTTSQMDPYGASILAYNFCVTNGIPSYGSNRRNSGFTIRPVLK